MKNIKFLTLAAFVLIVISLGSCTDKRIVAMESIVSNVMESQDVFWKDYLTMEKDYSEDYILAYNVKLESLFTEYYQLSSSFDDGKTVMGKTQAVKKNKGYERVAVKLDEYLKQCAQYQDLISENFYKLSSQGKYSYWLVEDARGSFSEMTLGLAGGVKHQVAAIVNQNIKDAASAANTEDEIAALMAQNKFLWVKGDNNEYLASFSGGKECAQIVQFPLVSLLDKIDLNPNYGSSDPKKQKRMRNFLERLQVRIDDSWYGIFYNI